MSREDESGSQVDHGTLPSPYFHRLFTSIHTPRPDRRSIKFVQPDDLSDESENFEALEDICGKRWKLFRVSPLHRFEYSAIRLRQYGKKLREYLSVLKKSDEDMEYQAKFSVVEDLTRVPQDYEAIKVSVTCSKNGQVYNSDYEGLFISWGSTRPPIVQRGVVSLPLLLCRGTVGLTNAVHKLLAQFFDCSINRLLLTEEEVFWLSAMLPAVCPTSRKSNKVNFYYSVPGIPTRGTLSFYCTQQTLVDIWKSIHDDQKDELLYSEIMTLQDGLMEHVFCVYGINLESVSPPSNQKKWEGSQDGIKSPLERVMIWSEQEACAKQVTQISTSACGATAVVNVLLALNIPFSLDRVKEGVATRVRAENASLPEYLLSRSVAGATHVDIIRGLEHASEGGLYARFFHMYPARAISLTRWLAYWMKKGAIPIATLNLQNGVAPGNPVPDAWHHQMVFGVGPRGVYLTNPLERVNEGALWPQLCSPSVLLVRRNDVLFRWNEQVDLRPLMTIPDQRWKRSNVLGQVVNIIRESMSSRAQGQGRVVTQHISIPASYCSGITLTISRESPGYDELKNASELPLLQQD